MKLLTSISLDSVQSLEEIFSYLTPGGWVVPAWLTALRQHVLETEDAGAEFLASRSDALSQSADLLRQTYH